MNQYNMGMGLQTPRLTLVNKALIIGVATFFIVGSLMEKSSSLSLASFLGISAHGVLQGKFYQFFTYLFVGRGLLEVIFNALLLWFIGSELEGVWGRRRYLGFVFGTVLGAGVIHVAVCLTFYSGNALLRPMVGTAGLVDALLVAYAILFPNRIFQFMLIIPVKAKYFCMILIAMELYSGFFSVGITSAWGQLGAMGSGFLSMVLLSSPLLRRGQKRRSSSSHAKKLKLVKNDDHDDRPKYWH